MSDLIKRAQESLDRNDYELIITTEGLRDGSDKWRIADFGVSDPLGETVFIGTETQVSEYVNNMIQQEDAKQAALDYDLDAIYDDSIELD